MRALTIISAVCLALSVLSLAVAVMAWEPFEAAGHVHVLPEPEYSYECPYGEMDADELHDANTVRAASRCWEDV